MELKLTDESLRSALSEAILSLIGPEAREAMIRDALAKLVAPSKDRYGSGNGPSEIEQSFAQASAGLMNRIVNKLVNEDPEISAKIGAFARTAIAKLLSLDNNELVDSFVKAFGKTFQGKEY